MIALCHEELKEFIEETGIKQRVLSEKTGIPQPALSLILHGKRKCEAGEYANICMVLNVPMDRFLKPKPP